MPVSTSYWSSTSGGARRNALFPHPNSSKPFRKEELIVALGDAIEGVTKFVVPEAGALIPMAEAEIIDWGAIERFRNDSGEEMLQLLLDIYRKDAVDKLARISTMAKSGEIGSEGVRLVHSLKSASAMAGAAALSRYCAIVEDKECASEADAQQLHRLFEAYHQALKTGGLIAA